MTLEELKDEMLQHSNGIFFDFLKDRERLDKGELTFNEVLNKYSLENKDAVLNPFNLCVMKHETEKDFEKDRYKKRILCATPKKALEIANKEFPLYEKGQIVNLITGIPVNINNVGNPNWSICDF